MSPHKTSVCQQQWCRVQTFCWLVGSAPCGTEECSLHTLHIYISTALRHPEPEVSGEARDEERRIKLPLVFRLLFAPLHLQTNMFECTSIFVYWLKVHVR